MLVEVAWFCVKAWQESLTNELYSPLLRRDQILREVLLKCPTMLSPFITIGHGRKEMSDIGTGNKMYVNWFFSAMFKDHTLL